MIKKIEYFRICSWVRRTERDLLRRSLSQLVPGNLSPTSKNCLQIVTMYYTLCEWLPKWPRNFWSKWPLVHHLNDQYKPNWPLSIINGKLNETPEWDTLTCTNNTEWSQFFPVFIALHYLSISASSSISFFVKSILGPQRQLINDLK